MSNIYLGAINKITLEYVYPKNANKNDKYICVDCNKDLILCKGKIRVPHFRHQVDTINPCNHYNKPTETQIHKNAKLIIKKLLENKTRIKFIRNYICCNKCLEIEIHQISDNSIISLEYSFNFNNQLKIVDVAHIIDNKIVSIFEICNTHKTNNQDRPEPWFEIDAITLLNLVNTTDIIENICIPCIRSLKCDECLEIDNLKINDFEKYIRIKLGQKIFPTPERKECLNTNKDLKQNLDWLNTDDDDNGDDDNGDDDNGGDDNGDNECASLNSQNEKKCECENCKYNIWYWNIWESGNNLNFDKGGHLMFQDDDDYDDNKKVLLDNKNIIELFNEFYYGKKVVIYLHKFVLEIYVIELDDYNKYDYWNTYAYRYGKDRILPYIFKINNAYRFNTETVWIIEYIINSIEIYINKYKYKTNEQVYNYEDNFNNNEKKIICDYNINNINDLLNHQNINDNDKQQCLKYYNYISKNFIHENGIQDMYEQPFTEILENGNFIKFDKYSFSLRILPDGSIKYCNCKKILK
jgi:hypothetical protein